MHGDTHAGMLHANTIQTHELERHVSASDSIVCFVNRGKTPLAQQAENLVPVHLSLSNDVADDAWAWA